jgi:hypothetical protein
MGEVPVAEVVKNQLRSQFRNAAPKPPARKIDVRPVPDLQAKRLRGSGICRFHPLLGVTVNTKPKTTTTTDNAERHAGFLTLLPKIEAHAQVVFRNVRCSDRKAELIQEAIALSWLWYKRLCEKGKNPAEFPSALAGYAARAVSSGRHLCGQESSRDVLSRLAQRRRQFFVSPLPERDTFGGAAWEEALQDNAQTPVPVAAAFRVDFPDWLDSLSERNRSITEDMALGHRTLELAEEYQLSPARISQLRRELHDDWRAFTEPVEPLAV